jgi:AraC family transcriptional activator of pobA
MKSTSNAILEKEICDAFTICYHQEGEMYASEPVRLVSNHIYFIRTAAGTLQVDDRLYDLSGSKLFLLAKGQVYRFLPGSKITGYELAFADSFWELAPASASNCKAVLFNNAAENQMLPLGTQDCKELDPLLQALLIEYMKMEYVNKPDALAAYLKIIMIKMANVNAALAEGYDDIEKKLFRRFKELITKDVYASHEVGEYAGRLGISARKLTGLCKRCSGKGAKELINSQLIAEAKRHLQFSTNPVKEIAFQLKFATPEHFSHFFKKNASVSPQVYRNHFVNIGM